MPLLIATTNPGKLVEMDALLAPARLPTVTPHDLGLRIEVQESGSDYAANARLKALAYARASGLWTLADDSGLEVDALAGAPGLYSARIAGPQADDASRRAALIERLRGHPQPWTARFYCAMILANAQGETRLTEGVCQGQIMPVARGQGGFGYDPLFLVEGQQATMAELSMETKNRISHRARALAAMLPYLRQLELSQNGA
jgi:XTP/dITP diphosphohydrolase